LIVCDNISAVNSIIKQLKDDIDSEATSSKIRPYTSSFDTDFQKEQHEKPLEPGDIIVATNLAGRGTDLKISAELEKNGGLHVIISYVPANARVEAQAQGRTARAGKPGTYQFVVCHPSLTFNEEDDAESNAAAELQRLKEERDEREAIRLEHLGTRGLDKIRLEEKLFGRFRNEIYDPIVQMMSQEKDKKYVKLQLNFLTNKWALWLDEQSSVIEDSKSSVRADLPAHFDAFKVKCLRLRGSMRFASSPNELIQLGRHFTSDDSKDTSIAYQCFRQVVDQEPDNCESALVHLAHQILQEQKNANQKLEAKRFLQRAKHLMQRKMEILSSSSEIIKLIIQLSKKGVVPESNNNNQSRFDEQVFN